MSTHAVTLRLPLPMYELFKSRAKRADRSMEVELLEAVATVAEDQESLAADLAEAVAGLKLLDDDDLWRAARTHLPSEHHDELEALNFKLQSEGLTETEQQRQEQLLTACDRVMLVRAHGAKLLKERGYDITELRGVK